MTLIDLDMLIEKLDVWRRLSSGEEKQYAKTAIKIARGIPVIARIYPLKPKKEKDK